MSKRRREYEAPDMEKMMTRVARALVRRAAEGDLEALTALANVDRALQSAICDAAAELHDDAGYSWSEIARELQITRQAAQQRFARTA
jgi:hypothetical protein